MAVPNIAAKTLTIVSPLRCVSASYFFWKHGLFCHICITKLSQCYRHLTYSHIIIMWNGEGSLPRNPLPRNPPPRNPLPRTNFPETHFPETQFSEYNILPNIKSQSPPPPFFRCVYSTVWEVKYRLFTTFTNSFTERVLYCEYWLAILNGCDYLKRMWWSWIDKNRCQFVLHMGWSLLR